MRKNLIVLSNGRELSSGVPGEAALTEVTLTQRVNSEEELTLGSVCAAMLEAQVLVSDGSWGINAGETLTLYQVLPDGSRVQQGIFIAETPERTDANIYRLTAYDRVVLLDKDLTDWLEGLASWPCTLQEFAAMVCRQCGLELAEGDLPNGSYPVRKFSAGSITGRQLIKWVAQIAGRFCRATADGKLEFAWYTPKNITVKPASGSVTVLSEEETLSLYSPSLAVEQGSDQVRLSSQMLEVLTDGGEEVVVSVETDDRFFYYRGSLSTADYAVQPVEKVHLKLSQNDVGTVWPNIEEPVNTYTISENYLLTGGSVGEYAAVAQTLYAQLSQVSYTPCTLTLPAGTAIQPGHILGLEDVHGNAFTVYVMEKIQTGQKDTLSCTGNPRRDSTTTVNNAAYAALTGKVLTLQKDVDGLQLENVQTGQKTARLALTVDGISTQVQKNENQTENMLQRMTTLEQNAQALSVKIQSVQETGVSKVTTSTGYTFDEDGLHISKDGEQMENRLDNTGMYVKRGDTVLLQANDQGVIATDVTVHNYLIAGGHARFESYLEEEGQARTACFFV